MKQLRIATAIAAASAAWSAHAQFDALGIDFNGNVYKFAISSGAGSMVGASGLAGTNCMARYSDEWYTVNNTPALCRINPATGASTSVFVLSLGGNTDVRGLAFDTNLECFVVVDKGGLSDELWKFNGLNGAGTLIGQMGSSTIQGLAVGFDGLLYAYDVSNTNSGGLKLVDRSTGATTDLNPSAPGTSNIQDICPSGDRFMGGRNSIYTVAPSNGFEILVGGSGINDLRGLGRRQNVLQVNSMTVRLGQLKSGSLSSILRKDGSKAVIGKAFVPNVTVSPVTVEVETGSAMPAAETRELGAQWFGKMLTAGSFSVSIDVLNRTTNVFETLTTVPVGLSQSPAIGAVVSNIPTYKDAGGNVTWRFRIKATGFVASPAWATEVEMFRCEEVGNF